MYPLWAWGIAIVDMEAEAETTVSISAVHVHYPGDSQFINYKHVQRWACLVFYYKGITKNREALLEISPL